MELLITHLLPYLPYNLQMEYLVRNSVERIGTFTGIIYDKEQTHTTKVSIDQSHFEYIWMFRPILKSLDNLTTEDTILLKLFINEDRDYVINNPLYCDYNTVQYLLSKHYDVFGLIRHGLATSKD